MTTLDFVNSKVPMPTDLGSAALRTAWSKELRAASLFSAKTATKTYIDMLKSLLLRYVAGEANKSDVRAELLAEQERLGMPASTSDSTDSLASMRNIASAQRLDLILETNQGQAASMAQLAGSKDPVQAVMYPAWRFKPGAFRRNHRDWQARWNAAGDSVGWEGASRAELIALKTSPIWQALGDGAGGYTDGLGTPYPPFAFGSSYNWSDVPRARCVELGLVV